MALCVRMGRVVGCTLHAVLRMRARMWRGHWHPPRHAVYSAPASAWVRLPRRLQAFDPAAAAVAATATVASAALPPLLPPPPLLDFPRPPRVHVTTVAAAIAAPAAAFRQSTARGRSPSRSRLAAAVSPKPPAVPSLRFAALSLLPALLAAPAALPQPSPRHQRRVSPTRAPPTALAASRSEDATATADMPQPLDSGLKRIPTANIPEPRSMSAPPRDLAPSPSPPPPSMQWAPPSPRGLMPSHLWRGGPVAAWVTVVALLEPYVETVVRLRRSIRRLEGRWRRLQQQRRPWGEPIGTERHVGETSCGGGWLEEGVKDEEDSAEWDEARPARDPFDERRLAGVVGEDTSEPPDGATSMSSLDSGGDSAGQSCADEADGPGERPAAPDAPAVDPPCSPSAACAPVPPATAECSQSPAPVVLLLGRATAAALDAERSRGQPTEARSPARQRGGRQRPASAAAETACVQWRRRAAAQRAALEEALWLAVAHGAWDVVCCVRTCTKRRERRSDINQAASNAGFRCLGCDGGMQAFELLAALVLSPAESTSPLGRVLLPFARLPPAPPPLAVCAAAPSSPAILTIASSPLACTHPFLLPPSASSALPSERSCTQLTLKGCNLPTL